MNYSLLLSGAVLLMMSGCASSPDPTQTAGSDPASSSSSGGVVERTSRGLPDAAASPLNDLNLRRESIPDLLRAIDNPYHVDPGISCDDIKGQVTALDELLGRDFDIPPPDPASLSERAAEGASTAFLDTISSTASSVIPLRGVVRNVSGANAHQRRVRKAYERGSHRRTFLKGIGLMKGCNSPAAPLPPPETDDDIVFK
jgi:hypothetical protein